MDDSDDDLLASDSQQQLSSSLPNLNSAQASAILATAELDKGTEKCMRWKIGFRCRPLVLIEPFLLVLLSLCLSPAWCCLVSRGVQVLFHGFSSGSPAITSSSLCDIISCDFKASIFDESAFFFTKQIYRSLTPYPTSNCL